MDVFCAGCGAQQGKTDSSPPPKSKPESGGKVRDALSSLTPQSASLLCYIPFVGWVACIVMLAADRFREDRDVRFHAFQGLYLFVLWLFVDWVFGPITGYVEGMRLVGRAMKLVVVGTWVFMLVKTSQGAMFRLPILGELAERSVSEQR